MCGSPQNFNVPAQPSYGEGMADALKAQVDLLKGEGTFKDTGALINLLPLEEEVRKKTAQTDTDVLRQTLLGSRESAEVSGTYDDQGRLVIGETPNFTETPGRPRINATFVPDGTGKGGKIRNLSFSDPSTGKILSSFNQELSPSDLGITGNVNSYNFYQKIDKVFRDGMAGNYQNAFNNAADRVQPTRVEGEPTPIYGRDESGKIITDITKVGETDTVTISEKQREGLVDILGDKRGVVEYETRKATQADVDDGLADEVGDTITTEFETGRQAGFDESGEFLGAAALADEITAANLSRQRERDLEDVERLQTRYQDVIDLARPGTSAGLDAAQKAITNEGTRITPAMAAPIIGDPADTFGGELEAVNVANPTTLAASTQFGGEAGLSQSGGTDSLRRLLLADAKAALDEELTDREKARIQEAFKGQSTMMGRTFDQRAGIAEAEALVEEDNARRMQNRAFAQAALGQEAGLQEGNLVRGMEQELAQANLQQRADLTQADIDTRQGIIDQGQLQQAKQFGVGATMDAERLNEQLRQQRLANYIGSVGALASIENQYASDPFRDLLGRGGADSLTAGQNVVGSASYGLTSQPTYLNPEAGLGYISSAAANTANLAAANAAAQGSARGGLFQGIGYGIGGYFCWVAREVYGPSNPSWLRFRMWMFKESPDWFFKLYNKYGERFASWISDKPRIKSFIRKWMDSKIKE